MTHDLCTLGPRRMGARSKKSGQKETSKRTQELSFLSFIPNHNINKWFELKKSQVHLVLVAYFLHSSDSDNSNLSHREAGASLAGGF